MSSYFQFEAFGYIGEGIGAIDIKHMFIIRKNYVIEGENLIIKKATVHDSHVISYIHASSWKAAYKNFIPQQYLDELRDDFWVKTFQNWIQNNTLTAQIIYDNQLAVGCISYGKSRDEKLSEWGEIVSIYLLPTYFGKGFGKKLLSTALDDLVNTGYKNVYLWVLENNQTARQFYERNGFICNNDTYSFEIMNVPLQDVRYVFNYCEQGHL